ncbi:MAG: hypothetical protein KBD78_15230 [Oligoflexales bacterium]|nr:hypothetical protein [Oligoflexales bacterium]
MKFIYYIFIIYLFSFRFAYSQSNTNERLTSLLNVGSIPANWQNFDTNDTLLLNFSERVNQAYLKAVRSSGKFRVINDSLVAKLWSSKQGREELIRDYEINAFLSLNVLIDGETIRFSSRLLSQELQPLILESSAIEKAVFFAFDDKTMRDVLESLIYRTANRIPVDMYVTSIQNTYVTLSGGARQRLEMNKEYEIYRVFIAERHRADQTWKKFYRELVGKVKIVDIKNTAAVGLIVAQSYPGAIEPGDTALIENIPSRTKFLTDHETPSSAESEKGELSVDKLNARTRYKTEEDVEYIKPLIKDGKLVDETANEAEQASPPEPKNIVKDELNKTNKEAEESERTEDTPEVSAEEEREIQTSSSKPIFEELRLRAGLNLWNASGPVSAKADFPTLIINELGASAEHQLSSDLSSEVDLNLLFGSTSSKSYSGLGAGARVFWSGETTVFSDSAQKYRFGGLAAYKGFGINGGKFGGGDTIIAGGFARVYDKLNVANYHFDSYYDFALIPISSGSFGINGKQRAVESSLGWEFKYGAMLENSQNLAINWGAELNFKSYTYTLEKVAELSYTNFGIALLMDYRF